MEGVSFPPKSETAGRAEESPKKILDNLKDTEDKTRQLTEWRMSGFLDQLSEDKKQEVVFAVAQILEETRDYKQRFRLCLQLLDVLVPAGRKDFSKKTFADYLTTSVLDLSGAGFPKAESELLNILKQVVYDSDPRVHPAEFLALCARARLRGKSDRILEQSLSFLLDKPSLAEIIKTAILETIKTDELQAILILNILEELSEEIGDNVDYGAPPIAIEEIFAAVQTTEASALVRRITESLANRLMVNTQTWRNRAAWAPDDFEVPPAPPLFKKPPGKKFNFEIASDEYLAPVAADCIGVYSEDMRRPRRVLKLVRQKKSYQEKDLRDLSSINLFGSKPDEATTRRREEAALAFTIFSQDDIVDKTSEDFGFPFRELTLREQVWFVNSLRGYTPDQEKVVSSFTQKFGLDGARAFLSCEYGDKFREVVLAIGEKFPPEVARQVFEQYGRLALLAQEKAAELIQEFTAEGKTIKIEAAEVEQELLSRAKNFLLEISRVPQTTPEVVQEKLARYETDMVVFAGIFKTAFKDASEVNFEEVRGLGFEQKKPAEITPDERAEILAIFQDNWREQKPAAAAYLQRGLETKLEATNNQSQFFLLKKDGRIIAFMRFDELETPDQQPSFYAASLNIKRDLRGSAMGEAVLKNTVDHQAADHVIYADVFPELQAGTKYVEEFGCVIVGVKDFPIDDQGNTEARLLLRRDDEANKKYLAREIDDITKETPEGVSLVSFDLSGGAGEMIRTIRKMENRGLVGTRYFSDPDNKNLRYIAFESAAEAVSAAA